MKAVWQQFMALGADSSAFAQRIQDGSGPRADAKKRRRKKE